MDTDAFIDLLLDVCRTGNLNNAVKLPGAGVQSQVLLATCRLRGAAIQRIADLPISDRVAFAKALAVYENSVGGIGSVTALRYVMCLFGDAVHEGYETFSWIVDNTNSLWWYGSAVDFIEPHKAAVLRAAAQAEIERRNYELAAPARLRRAERATGNLYNSVRRGDIKAVEALLAKGGDPMVMTPIGEPLISYARASGREDIAMLLEAARDANGVLD